MRRFVVLSASHAVALAVGFGLGVYLLPILTAPDGPDSMTLQQSAANAVFSAELSRDLRGSDLLHWGEGRISLTESQIIHEGRLAPGPDYRLYLVPEFVDHEDAFLPLKQTSLMVGPIDTFSGFIVDVPEGVNLSDFTTVLVWCEAFGEFITAGRYR